MTGCSTEEESEVFTHMLCTPYVGTHLVAWGNYKFPFERICVLALYVCDLTTWHRAWHETDIQQMRNIVAKVKRAEGVIEQGLERETLLCFWPLLRAVRLHLPQS